MMYANNNLPTKIPAELENNSYIHVTYLPTCLPCLHWLHIEMSIHTPQLRKCDVAPVAVDVCYLDIFSLPIHFLLDIGHAISA